MSVEALACVLEKKETIPLVLGFNFGSGVQGESLEIEVARTLHSSRMSGKAEHCFFGIHTVERSMGGLNEQR